MADPARRRAAVGGEACPSPGHDPSSGAADLCIGVSQPVAGEVDDLGTPDFRLPAFSGRVVSVAARAPAGTQRHVIDRQAQLFDESVEVAASWRRLIEVLLDLLPGRNASKAGS